MKLIRKIKDFQRGHQRGQNKKWDHTNRAECGTLVVKVGRREGVKI